MAGAAAPPPPDETSPNPTSPMELTSSLPSSARSEKKEYREDRETRKSLEAMSQSDFDFAESSRKAPKGDKSAADTEKYKRELKEKYIKMLESKKLSGRKKHKLE